MLSATHQLLRQIERFCARHDTSATAFGRQSMGDPSFVHKLKAGRRSEEHTSELQSLMRISYAVFCLKKKNTPNNSILRHTNRRRAYLTQNNAHTLRVATTE